MASREQHGRHRGERRVGRLLHHGSTSEPPSEPAAAPPEESPGEPASASPPKPPVVLHPSGRLNLVSAPQLRVTLRETVEAGDPFVVIDLAEVTFIDSSGLAAIVSGLKSCRQAGGDLRIAAPTEQVLSVLRVTTLDRVLHPYASVEDALAQW